MSDDGINPAYRPMSKTLFLIIIIAFLSLLVSMALIIVPWLIAREPTLFQTIVFIALTLVCLVAALGITKAIPKDSLKWEEWRRPVVLSKVIGAVLLTGLSAPMAFIWFLGPLPQAEAQEQPPAILALIEGRWGEEADCALVWDIRLMEIAGERAIEAEMVVRPEDFDPFTFLGEVTALEDLSLTASGLEPASARGSTAIFTLNPATERLSWEDRAKPGDVEVYRRCPQD